jgi:hypothetical protein
MKKIFLVLLLVFFFSGNTYADVQVLECKQIIEIDDDVGDDIIIKHIVKIDFDTKSINSYCASCNDTGNTLYEILNITDVSIEGVRKPKPDYGTQVLSLNRYTLEMKYHFYKGESVYEGVSIFECNILEKKI